MSAYLALVWNPSSTAQTEQAMLMARSITSRRERWIAMVQAQGLAVFTRQAKVEENYQAYLLGNQQGLVWGKLFERGDATSSRSSQRLSRQALLENERTDEIVSSGGRVLVRKYWGHYVSFVRDSACNTTYVLRDPIGHIPCQHTTVRNVQVFFIRLEDCLALEPRRFSINKHYVLGYLALNTACVHETGLNEVDTVLPGECTAYGAGGLKREFYWSPLAVAKDDVIENARDGARLLRETARDCVHAWASCFDHIALRLSGGLDSSIVASALADAPTSPKVTCINNFTFDPGSDERSYAREVANRFGMKLLERPANTDQVFELTRNVPLTLFPFTWWTSDANAARSDVKMLQDDGVQALFSGHGGDELFFRGGPFPTAVDYAWQRGIFRPGFLSIAMNDAYCDGIALPHVLRLAYRYGLRRRRWNVRRLRNTSNSIVPRPLKEQAWNDASLWHPLFSGDANMPPGKYWHAYVLTFGTAYVYTPTQVEPAYMSVSPLASQPLLELSLRLPLYILRAGSRDRGLTRQAFAPDLPERVIHRRSKSYGNVQMLTILQKNIHTVRELLLDGFLAKERLIDPKFLEGFLSGRLSTLRPEIVEIGHCLSIEGWARSWTQSQPVAG